jgi:glycerol-3-phosphate acyltransferase PlsY
MFVALGVGYLLIDSVCVSARAAHRGIDLRLAGSGNVGAANLLERRRRKLA